MQSKIVGPIYKIKWPFRYWRAPVHFDFVERHSLPRHHSFTDEDFNGCPTLTLSFVGDFMGIGSHRMLLGENLKKIFKRADHVIVNLETVLWKGHGPIVARQYTDPSSFMDFHEQLGGTDLVVGLANNHLYDYGPWGLERSLHVLEELGLNYFGLDRVRSFEPVAGLEVVGKTMWKRKKDGFVNTGDSQNILSQKIEFLHWGEEFIKNPTPSQFQYADKSESLFIVGHHSHNPQPIHLIDEKLCAFSLGNFATRTKSAKINAGLVLTVDLAFKQEWKVVSTHWNEISITPDQTHVRVEAGSRE